ncbi:unnamed protein product [Rotaria magnacalcarata]|uniref:Uncharacterized protein n=1 Tax=Rotaria magnacalcarata TaxID=392030 RepID=A0A817AAD6_9BILA|nr:unnamed protein product [Rotaria magnacalcarata]CAF4034929.1 unnamed protein product [Rotaria magnacalcarata]CAF4155636.1 unnamed protein product [Rotaria magnacalcarata]
MGDIFESLRHEHEKILSPEDNIPHVYRGMKLENEEFERLKENQGKFISTNGYLSTSRNKPINRSKPNVPSKGHFENLNKTRNNGVYIIFFIFVDSNDLVDHKKRVDTNLKIDKSIVFADIAEYSRAWIEFHIGRAYQGKGEFDKARKYYELACNLMNNSTSPRILDYSDPLNRIDDILHERNELDDVLKYYQRALEIREKLDGFCLIDIAADLGNIGLVLDEKQKSNEALNYYQRALKMYQKFDTFGHNDTAKTLTRIGDILYQQTKCGEALDYHE